MSLPGPAGARVHEFEGARPMRPASRRCRWRWSLIVIFGLVPAALFPPAVARADISVRASVNPQRAQMGEPITLTIEISGAQNISAPALGNLDGFEPQYLGPSTQISIVNGQMSASVQHRYSLLPLRAGHFTLGPFPVDYQGKQYQTAALGVDVAAASQGPQGQPGAQGRAPAAPGGARAAPPPPGAPSPRALRLALSVPQQELYLHQRVPMDVTLYVGSIRVADVQYPTLAAEGLSMDKFPEPNQHQQVIDGETYQVLHFQTAITPLRAGQLTLGPATLRLNVLNRRRGGMFSDPFFEQFFQDDPFSTERRPLDVRSDPIALNVLPLPEEGKPAGFSGAVGAFTLQVTALPTELDAGDPITVRMTVSGTGSLAEAGPPAISSTEGFRTYDVNPTKSDTAGAGALSVTKGFEQVLIPNAATVRALPPVRFSYFDPQARQYRTLESQPIALVVRPPQQAARSEIVAGKLGAPSAPEEKLGRDIVYVKDDPGHLRARAATWYDGWFFLWQPLPLALLAAAVWYDRRRQRLSGDLRYARFSRAGKEARRGLAAAAQALGNGNRAGFYDVVSRTMQEYLGAKLDLPPGAIDAEAVGRCGVSEECLRPIHTFFTTCEHIRFAPSAGEGDMQGTLSLAQEIVRQLERRRRLSRGSLDHESLSRRESSPAAPPPGEAR